MVPLSRQESVMSVDKTATARTSLPPGALWSESRALTERNKKRGPSSPKYKRTQLSQAKVEVNEADGLRPINPLEESVET